MKDKNRKSTLYRDAYKLKLSDFRIKKLTTRRKMKKYLEGMDPGKFMQIFFDGIYVFGYGPVYPKDIHVHFFVDTPKSIKYKTFRLFEELEVKLSDYGKTWCLMSEHFKPKKDIDKVSWLQRNLEHITLNSFGGK